MARAIASTSAAVASVPGVRKPLLSRCISNLEVENPNAPAATASCTSAAIASISSGFTGSAAAPPGRSDALARLPITHVRTAAWPTIRATSQANSRRATESKYSSKVSQSQTMP